VIEVILVVCVVFLAVGVGLCLWGIGSLGRAALNDVSALQKRIVELERAQDRGD
jgi:hypothetical protein